MKKIFYAFSEKINRHIVHLVKIEGRGTTIWTFVDNLEKLISTKSEDCSDAESYAVGMDSNYLAHKTLATTRGRMQRRVIGSLF